MGSLLVAAPTSAAYQRVAEVEVDDDIGVVDGAVVLGTTPVDGPSVLLRYALDGTARTIPLLDRARFVEELKSGSSALGVLTIPEDGGPLDGYFGPAGGPLTRLPRGVIDVAASGDRVVSLHRRGRDRGWVDVREVSTGRTRRHAVRGKRVALVTAAGRYVAYSARFASPREVTIVIHAGTGRELYRARTPRDTAYGLAENGRLWYARGGRRSGEVWTATRAHPRPRRVASFRLAPYDLAVSGGELVLVQSFSDGTSRVVALRPDGTRRPLTQALADVGAIAADRQTLAFVTGRCVFAGSAPTAAPQPLVLDGCEPAR